ncbi:hypothetical protein EJ04DRAFT_595238 [Polyplosphaeria fusca]|uniref:Heterokaryon incompatibility domain-containing protein n=1 Tax=Polyplosphaeria fusca TaxID=682080 RepID=A0A9P4QMA1_9PLEO|nr:hypothetical protein EJ04DRAFT_595238 [Polyplosphaeria fusca]
MDLFDDECQWPRRLLHIPSMTSYEWRPGDWYGDFQKPKYSILSYTWGRWEIRDPSTLQHVRPIQIHGIAWEVPRVDPEAFTDDEFLAVIRDTASPHPEVVDSEHVDFLWLDVACIHQSDEEEKAKEIGRQAIIFRGASHGYIWIRQSKEFIRQWCEDFDKAFAVLTTDAFKTTDHGAWTSCLIDLIQKLFSDAWFSSLWTLQEAFLRPTATFIFKDADKNSMDHCTLKMISDALVAIKESLTSTEGIRQLDSALALRRLIDEIGFVGYGSGNLMVENHMAENPMALLAASHGRTASRVEDRVYGIMQIFDVSVGRSATGAESGHEYTLLELEEQLGTAILLKHPILSQLHVHTVPVDMGTAWRFSQRSTVPERTKVFTNNDLCAVSKLSVQRLDENVLIGEFSGKTASFQRFASRLAKDWPHSWNLNDTSIYLDATDNTGLESDVPHAGTGTLQTAAWLSKHSPQTHILLLALKTSNDPMAPRDNPWAWALGILMHPTQIQLSRGYTDFWRRQGIFIWDVRYKRSAARASSLGFVKALLHEIENLPEDIFKACPYLIGEDEMWSETRGYFG